MAKRRVALGDKLYRVDFDDGRAYYFARFSVGGKLREKSLGRADEIGVREARKRLAELLTAEEIPAAAQKTFGEIYEQAVEDIKAVKRWKNPKSEKRWLATLERYAVPAFGAVPVDQVTREQVVAALRPIWERIPETARRVQQRLDAVFSWAMVRGLRRGDNPAIWRGGLEFYFPASGKVKKERHHTAPTLDELRAAVQFCELHHNAGSGVLLLTIATACRVSEARLATADQIDLGHSLWDIPAESRKTGDRLRVPLSSLALEAVAMGETAGLLFRGTKGPLALDTPRMKFTNITGRAVTVHGIRSTFRDWCAETGVPDAVAEKCLGHQWGNEVTRAYYRSDLLEERRAVLEKWAAELKRAPRK